MANHIKNFITNLTEINNLIKFHQQISGTGRGRRKPGIETLNKSAIVLLTACWESYIEELASASFDYLVDNCTIHSQIPNSVLTKASQELKDSCDTREIRKLAGDGWKEVLKKHKRNILDKKIDFFHVPRPDNIDQLFEELIGFNGITKNWKWKKKSNIDAKKTLNLYIDLRGNIAHKLKAGDTVLKKDVKAYREFLKYISVISHNRINTYLGSKIGKKPWIDYNVGKTR